MLRKVTSGDDESVRRRLAQKDEARILDLACGECREAEVLTGMTIRDEDAMTEAAAMMLTLGLRGVFLHGGSFGRDHATDILATAGAPALRTVNAAPDRSV